MTPRRRSVWDKPEKQDIDEKAICMAAFVKSTKSAAKSFCKESLPQASPRLQSQVFSADAEGERERKTPELQQLYLDSAALFKKNRKGSNGADSDSRTSRDDGTRTPTESSICATESSEKTSTCASPPPELQGQADDAEDNMHLAKTPPRRFSYATVEECVNNKVEFKRIIRLVGQKAENKYQSVRNMFIAVDRDGDGKLSVKEVVHLFANFGLEAELAERFFGFMDKDGSGEVSLHEFMATFGPVMSEKRDHTFRDRRSVTQRYNTWRAVPGPVPGMQRMVLA